MDSESNFSNSKQIKCPQCGRLTLYSSQNPARPFCSERCKLIDLGAWASEGYKIPIQGQNYNENELEQLYEALNSEEVTSETEVAGRRQQE